MLRPTVMCGKSPTSWAECDRIPRRSRASLDPDLTGARQEEVIDQPEDGRLADPAPADEHEHVAGLHGEADVVKDRDAAGQPVLHVLKFNRRCHGLTLPQPAGWCQ